jgi:hypothetical protein
MERITGEAQTNISFFCGDQGPADLAHPGTDALNKRAFDAMDFS